MNQRIDFHVHLFPDFLAPRALGKLALTSGIAPATDGTLADTLQKLDRWGITRAVALHIATSPAQQSNVNRFAKEIDGDRLISFASVHVDSPDAPGELERLAALGLRGVKLHPDYQGFAADDRRAYPIYERIAALGLPLVLHTGFDPISPGNIHATPARLARVLDDFPSLRLICAHLGSMMLWNEVEEQLCGRDVYFDTACIAGHIDPAQAKRIIRRHGAHRVLFASDCPWQAADVTRALIDSLGLRDEELEQIYYKNALTLLGEDGEGSPFPG